jgi:hypothetical protein
MIRFAEKFSNFKIVAELAPQLSWSHFIERLFWNLVMVLHSSNGKNE